MGWSGFGMLLNRTYPMSSPDHPVSGSTWISFHPGSLIRTLVLSFAAAFVIFLIIHLVRKKKASKASKA
jgi:large-conductance mechanosensitive channel